MLASRRSFGCFFLFDQVEVAELEPAAAQIRLVEAVTGRNAIALLC
jgi:hypothetical protein